MATVLILGELTTFLKLDKTPFTRGRKEAEQEFRQTGRNLEREADATSRAMATALAGQGRHGGDGFVRGADGRLRDSRGRFVSAGQEAGRAAAGGFAQLTGALGDLGGAVGSVGGSLWGLIPILSALAAGAVVAIPVIYALGGALASLPALAVGGGAAIGTLALGFDGLAEAFQKTTRAGGSAVDRAYQVARAERQVRDANREVLDSQLALNRARMAAAERLQDLNRNLASARLDEESAVLAVAEAEKDLREARRGGDRLQVRRAELAYRQAQQAVEDVRDRVGDLEQEQADAAAKGVEGSEEVTAALRRQERAVEGVADAEHALSQARKPAGGGGAAAETTKLAASAQQLVSVLKGLAPEWDSLRLGVQQRLFAGVGREVQLLADAWLPRLEVSLGKYADTFNGIFKTFSETARDPEVMDDLGIGMETVRVQIEKVGAAIAGPGVKAFAKLAAAAKPFLDVLGDKLAGAIESFATWIDDAEESGELAGFFETAAYWLGEVWDLGGDLLGLFGDFFGMWTDSENGDAATGLFDSIRNGIKDLRTWLEDPENKQNLQDFIDGFVAIGSAVMDVLGWLIETGIPAAWGALEWLDEKLSALSDTATKVKDWIVAKWNSLVSFVTGLPSKISSAASGLWSGIKEGFKSALNWIIDKWNGLSFTLPGFTAFGQNIGGGTLSTPNIPRLDVGGRILRDGLAMVHQSEVVMPAAQVRRLERGEPAVDGATGGQLVDIKVTVDTPEGGVLRVVRKTTRTQGGRTDRVLVGR
ncbi:hypothetical protein GCM10009662_06620 [Catellatospora coxensis]